MLLCEQKLNIRISPEQTDQRLDKVLAELLPEYSRATLQKWLKEGLVLVDDRIEKPKYKLSGNELLSIRIPEATPSQNQPQDVPLDIIHEDDSFLVINKPTGLVVHPGAGNPDQTLLNGLLFYYPQLQTLPRAGIVHRIDKDTSGLLVIAKTEKSRRYFVEQLKNHAVTRQYIAIVNGHLTELMTINEPIGRHRFNRLKMTVTGNGKPAITHITPLQLFRHHTLIQADLETGRTHQIRVHLSHSNHPIIGDPLYGYKRQLSAAYDDELRALLDHQQGQALHAKHLSFAHPDTGKLCTYKAPTPKYFKRLVHSLEQDYLHTETID